MLSCGSAERSVELMYGLGGGGDRGVCGREVVQRGAMK